jgi:hypothetical protein
MPVGTSSISLMFVVTNSGSSAAIAAALGNTTDFAISGNNCTTLATNGTCSVAVVFAPKSSGPKVTQLTVTGTSGSTATTAIAMITGSAPMSSARLSVSPSSRDLGTVVVGVPSLTGTFQVSNTGTAPTGPLAVSLAGSSDFLDHRQRVQWVSSRWGQPAPSPWLYRRPSLV